VTSNVLIKKVDDNFELKQIIIVMFNAQFAVMRQIVSFKINKRKIENINEYKNYCESIIVRTDISYLKN